MSIQHQRTDIITKEILHAVHQQQLKNGDNNASVQFDTVMQRLVVQNRDHDQLNQNQSNDRIVGKAEADILSILKVSLIAILYKLRYILHQMAAIHSCHSKDAD